MTATVLDLTSRLPQPCDCPPHRLAGLASRLRTTRDQHADELLIPVDTFASALDNALAVLDQIVSDHTPSHERTKP